jgi:hypothetical protein
MSELLLIFKREEIMYSIECHTNRTENTVVYKSKNSSGQILMLTLYLWNHVDIDEYYIEFWIGKRKKGFQHGFQTGKDGIKSLLWAKDCIKDFISKPKNKRIRIMTGWTDKRRRDIYKWGLKDLGFSIGKYHNQFVLALNVSNKST